MAGRAHCTSRKLLCGFSLLSLLLFSACETSSTGTSSETIGTAVGAAAGALIGSQVGDSDMAVVGGAILGGALGNIIGRHMDEQDRKETNEALETAATSEQRTWKNPDTQNEYSVTPTRTYESNDRPCRDFDTEIVTAEGERVTEKNTACRSEDGTWEVVG